ncbi:MAG: holo-ACP synthase [Terriglobales bacterium]
MIVGVGIDLVANSRVERELARGEWLLGDGVFTTGEISRCRRNRRPAICYAACFAAKEATLKALGIEVADLGILREVELDLGEGGKSAVVLHERLKSESEHLEVKRIRVAIASGKQQTGAMVILES